MFGAMYFIYYINRSIATKVDSTYLGYSPTAHGVICLCGERWAQIVTFRSRSPTLSRYTTHVDKQ